MILTCPACATSYFIPDDAVGSNGRKVRCQSCGEVWRAGVDEPLELTLTPDQAAPAPAPSPQPASVTAAETASLAQTPAPELPRAFRARAEQQRRFRRAAAHGVIWAGLAAVFIGLIVSAFLFRVEVVKAFPRAAAAYAMVGAPVNPIGLDFEAMSARAAPNAPGMVVVSGAIRNVRDAEIVSPPVRVALLDEHGAEIAFKVVPIDAAPVLPGKVQGFAVLIPDPSGKAADIGVNFVPGAPPAKAVPADKPVAAAPAAPPAQGLRSAVAPGVGARDAAPPIEARPMPKVDSAPAEAVSAGHHG